MKKSQKWAGWLVLAVIVAVTAVALALNNNASIQKAPSDPQLAQAREALGALFPEADADGYESLDAQQADGSFAYAVKKNGEIVGFALKQTAQGYGGPIEVIAGFETSGAIRGISVGGESFNETEGLGAKAKDTAFTGQYAGKTPPLELNRDIDAISGATVTSTAVTDAVNQAASRLNTLREAEGAPAPAATPSATEGARRTANVSALGYGGPVLVRVTLDAQGAVSAIDVGGARFQETEGVGSRVREEAFTQQFVGQTPPVKLGEGIDAVSGATVSSQAVVDAVNEAATFLDRNAAN
ncbi:MAG: FMN-binding protein [Clostridiales bacterium]|nr:FMN-binding protein [Clostridiales bacterium]